MLKTLLLTRIVGMFETVGSYFVSKEKNSINKERLAVVLAAGLFAGCLYHADNVDEFAVCVRSTTMGVLSQGGFNELSTES